MTTMTHTPVTAGTYSSPISDHLPIYAIFHTPTKRRPKNKTKTLSRARYSKQKSKILTTIKQNITAANNNSPADSTTDSKIRAVQQAIKRAVEQYQVAPKPRRQPWCTPKFRRQIQKQHTLHQRAITQPTRHNITAHTQFKNKLQKKIKQAKKQQLVAELDQARKTNNAKQLQQTLEKATGRKNTTRTSPTKIVYEGKTYTDPQDIANALNSHYISIGNKTSQTIPTYPAEPAVPPPQPPPQRPPPFQLKPTTPKEVETYMRKTTRQPTFTTLPRPLSETSATSSPPSSPRSSTSLSKKHSTLTHSSTPNSSNCTKVETQHCP